MNIERLPDTLQYRNAPAVCMNSSPPLPVASTKGRALACHGLTGGRVEAAIAMRSGRCWVGARKVRWNIYQLV